MPTPSLLIVPARFKTGKLYSQIPTSGAGDFTVTRNTEARRFDSAGLIASVASGIPRLDYYTSGGVTGCPALLVEPAATNFIFPSNLSGSWSFGSTVSATTSVAAPDGTNTLAFNSNSSGNTEFTISRVNDALASGAVATFSCFAKIKDANVPVLQIVLGTSLQWSPNAIFANFNLASGTISAGTYTSARIENYGNGWYRCSVTATSTVGTGTNRSFVLQLQTSPTATREAKATITTGTGMYLWGAQLETGSVATSHIPTTTGQGSRSADAILVSGAVSGSIGQTEGTLYVELDTRNLFETTGVFNIRSATNNYVMIYMSNVARRFSGLINAAGTSVTVGQTANGLSAGIYKMALAYKSNDCAFYVNGTLIGNTGQATMPTGMTEVNLGQDATSPTNRIFNDRIRAVALYNTRLLNAELATLTTP